MSGLVTCFLCSASVYYEMRDKSSLQNHMTIEHNAFSGTDFLLAGCTMNNAERLAIVNVVKDREPSTYQPIVDDNDGVITLKHDEVIIDEDSDSEENHISALTSESTLPEIETGAGVEVVEEKCVSPPNFKSKPSIEFSCPDCPLTFNLKIRLNKHIRLHEESKDKNRSFKIDNLKLGQSAETQSSVPCSECGKFFTNRARMMRHVQDIHKSGEFPCRGCEKVFTSRNKMSSHFSRYCTPLNPIGGRRKTST